MTNAAERRTEDDGSLMEIAAACRCAQGLICGSCPSERSQRRHLTQRLPAVRRDWQNSSTCLGKFTAPRPRQVERSGEAAGWLAGFSCAAAATFYDSCRLV